MFWLTNQIPMHFSVLKKRLEHKKNVILHQAAISNYDGQAELWLHEQHTESEIGFSQASSLQAEKNNVSKDSVTVEVFHIASILSTYDHIRLLKIDIEGGEYDILDDVLKAADKIDIILLETHGDKNEAFADKEKELHQKIHASPYRDKFYTDWI